MTIYLQEHTVPRPHLPGGGNWVLRNLSHVSVLAGKNGSGKSVLLRSWRDQHQEGVHYVVPERTGEMDFQPHLLQEEMQPSSRRNASVRNFVPDYRRRIIGRIQTYFMIRGNARGGSVAPCSPDELEFLLGLLLPDFEVHLQVGGLPYRLTRVATNQEISNVDQLSSGEAQLLTIGLDILTIAAIWEIEQRQQRIILLDEPDAHIHPDLQARFADFLFKLLDRFSLQFVVATHSTSLLSALGQFGGDRTAIVYLDRTRLEYSARRFDAITKEMASCLGGHVLMGPLFGAPILLVEGDDDYRIWGQVPRHHVLNLSVIPTNGDEIRRYQLALERILGSLSEPQERPVGFALLDGDKSLPTPNPDNRQNFIRYIRLQCREAENLYLTDKVLEAINLTWPIAAVRIKDAHEKFGKHAEFAKSAEEWDRKQVDLKPIMGDLVGILDPKNVPWTTRLAAAIGRQKPAGELAEFLGNDTLTFLWPE